MALESDAIPSTRVTVSLYGSLASLAGSREREMAIPGPAPTVADLRAAISRELPQLSDHVQHLAIGIGTQIVKDDAPLEAGQEISLLPPVSGG